MANEITIRGKLAFAKGASGSFDEGEILVTMAGQETLEGQQSVTTAEEALVIGEVNPAGAWVIFKHRSGAGNLLVRQGTGTASTIEVRPTETSGPFRFPTGTTAPFVLSSSGTVTFSYLIVEA